MRANKLETAIHSTCMPLTLVHMICSCENTSCGFGCLWWFYYPGPALHCWFKSFVVEGIFFAQGDYSVVVGMNTLILNHKYLGKPGLGI